MSNIYFHNHHIVPRHTWKRLYGSLEGFNHTSNIIQLTLQEHAAWHYEQWVYFGYKEDKLAWKALSGQIGKEEIFYEKSKLGGLWHIGKKRKKNNNILKGDNHPMKKYKGFNHPKYKPPIIKTCLNCEQIYECKVRFANKSRFCCKSCWNAYMKRGNHYNYNGGKTIKLNCQQCYQEFFVYKNSKRKYCSRICSDIGGGLTRKGDNHWKHKI